MRAVNLIPGDQRRGGGSGSGGGGSASYVVLGVLGVLVIAMAALVLTGNTVNARKGDVAKANQEAASLEQQAATLKPYSQFATLSESRVATVKSLAESRFDWERAMRDLSRVLPADVWLTSLVGTVAPGVSFEGGGGGGATGALRSAVKAPAIEMVGCTVSQASVSRLMARLRTMRGVSRVSLAASEKADSQGSQPGGASGGGGSTGDCRNGDSRFPQFQIVVFFDSPKTPTIPGASGDQSAAAGQPQTQGVSNGGQSQ
jgi:Tfp pilus assembly protein PilN